MNENIFQGQWVRLVAGEPEALSQTFSRWGRDTEYHRLLDNEPARLWSSKKRKEWIEKDLVKEPTGNFYFMICTLSEDKLIGFAAINGVRWSHGDSWLGIGIGEREYWDRGYGTDAMHILLRYAFTELNLYRVTLGVFEYNYRAIHTYEKAGFSIEGRERRALLRDGERADIIFMGILRDEWRVRNG